MKISCNKSVRMIGQKSYNDTYVIPKILKVNPKLAERISACSTISYTLLCTSCGAHHYHGAKRCGSRWCRVCANLRMLTTANVTLEKLIPYLDKGHSLSLLTFTIKDSDNLPGQIEELLNGWKALKDNQSTRNKFKSRIIGGLRALEVKIGKNSGLWHAHMHVLLLHPKTYEKDYDWIKPAWKKITNNTGSIEIHKIKNRKNQTLGVYGAILEVTKYISSPDKKTLSIDDHQFAIMFNSVYRKRLKSTFGVLRNCSKTAEDQIMNEKEKDIIDFACRLCQCTEYEFTEILTQYIIDKNVVVYD